MPIFNGEPFQGGRRHYEKGHHHILKEYTKGGKTLLSCPRILQTVPESFDWGFLER